MDNFAFFKVVLLNDSYAEGFVEFIVKAETAKQAFMYVEHFYGGNVAEVSPTKYFDFVSVPKDYLSEE